jgi:hypothetical protein
MGVMPNAERGHAVPLKTSTSRPKSMSTQAWDMTPEIARRQPEKRATRINPMEMYQGIKDVEKSSCGHERPGRDAMQSYLARRRWSLPSPGTPAEGRVRANVLGPTPLVFTLSWYAGRGKGEGLFRRKRKEIPSPNPLPAYQEREL